MKTLFISLLFIFFTQISSANNAKYTVNGKEVKYRTLTNINEIQKAYDIRMLLKKLSKDVSSCMDSGNTNNKCKCIHKEKNMELSSTIASALKKYPHWLSAKALKVNFNGTKGILFVKSLQKQARQKLQC
ncbi:MAG: hypothetical protein V3R49_04520 [Gammaproteobacteria bacterium]